MPTPPKEPPILLVKWHDLTGWVLDRVEAFPKNQRFIFARIASTRPETIAARVGKPVTTRRCNHDQSYKRAVVFVVR